jgi:hypothetical protein
MHVHIAWGLTLAEYIKHNRTVATRLGVTITKEDVVSEPEGFIQMRTAWY